MNIQIEREHVEALMQRFPARTAFEAQLRFSDRVEVEMSHPDADELDFLEDLYACRVRR